SRASSSHHSTKVMSSGMDWWRFVTLNPVRASSVAIAAASPALQSGSTRRLPLPSPVRLNAAPPLANAIVQSDPHSREGHSGLLIQRGQPLQNAALTLRGFSADLVDDDLVELLHGAEIPDLLHRADRGLEQVRAARDALVESDRIPNRLGLVAFGILAHRHRVGAQHLRVGVEFLDLRDEIDVPQALFAVLGDVGRTRRCRQVTRDRLRPGRPRLLVAVNNRAFGPLDDLLLGFGEVQVAGMLASDLVGPRPQRAL